MDELQAAISVVFMSPASSICAIAAIVGGSLLACSPEPAPQASTAPQPTPSPSRSLSVSASDQMPERPARLALRLEGADSEGVVHLVAMGRRMPPLRSYTVDLGDGQQRVHALDGSCGPSNGGGFDDSFFHRYDSPGAYRLLLTVQTADCGSAQVVADTVAVTVTVEERTDAP